MPRETPRMLFPFPAEGDDPFFDFFRQFTDNVDAAAFALSDNCNLISTGTATFSWDAASGVLSWDDSFFFSGHTTGFRVEVPGPDSATILDGQVLLFTMPRLLTANTTVSPTVSARVAESAGVKIHDRIVICVRVGSTIYFRNGVTLKDGDTGQIWERPLVGGTTGMSAAERAVVNSALHVHQEYVFQPPVGATVITMPNPAPEVYRRFVVYRNGARQVEGASNDYTKVLVAPFQITLTRPIADTDDRIVVEAEISVTVPAA